MPQIEYVHGNELPQRGKEVKGKMPFIPYTEMTAGEVHLALLEQQARVYAQAFPENPEYKQAVSMLENALYSGVHGSHHFIGSISKELQPIARAISKAQKNIRWATGSNFGPARKLVQGAKIGEGLVESVINENDCEDYATRVTNDFYSSNLSKAEWKALQTWLPFGAGDKKKRWLSNRAECQVQKEIERIYNEKLENASHHVLYHQFRSNFKPIQDTRVDFKRVLHVAGTEALANAGRMQPGLMSVWVETGILRTNAAGGVGPVGSVPASFDLSPENEQLLAIYQGTQKKKDKIGEPVTAAAVVALVTAALTVAGQIVAAVQQKRAGAFAAVQGFGTSAFSAETSDWANIDAENIPTNNTDLNKILPLLLIAGGVAIASK